MRSVSPAVLISWPLSPSRATEAVQYQKPSAPFTQAPSGEVEPPAETRTPTLCCNRPLPRAPPKVARLRHRNTYQPAREEMQGRYHRFWPAHRFFTAPSASRQPLARSFYSELVHQHARCRKPGKRAANARQAQQAYERDDSRSFSSACYSAFPTTPSDHTFFARASPSSHFRCVRVFTHVTVASFSLVAPTPTHRSRLTRGPNRNRQHFCYSAMPTRNPRQRYTCPTEREIFAVPE